MTEGLWSFHGGVHPVQHKNVSIELPLIKAQLPDQLILPLQQHIGQPAEPLVSIGDSVRKGQMIAQASGFVSSPLHAPTSGRIRDIRTHIIPHPSGLNGPCIFIEPDGEDRSVDGEYIDDFHELAPSALRNAIRDSGIVGLGGAGFPAFIKLNPGPKKMIDTLVINGIECEPYITCDDVLMRHEPDKIIGGVRIMQHALQARKCVLAIEDNKLDAFRILSERLKGEADIEIVLLPTRYPQGSEKQLIYVLTGKEVPTNGLAVHIGVVCQNVGTASAVYDAIVLGRPLISRYVTVAGSAVQTPRNLEASFGIPIRNLLQQCDADFSVIERLIMGGPMMGFALPSDDIPMIKTTNAILASTARDLMPQKPAMPCIRCGACADACPINLLPQQLYWYSRSRDTDKVQEYDLFDCIECGCCAYVCPSNIPLVQYYRFAKGEIWNKEREKEKADKARERHDFRLQRLAREKAERAAKHDKKKAALQRQEQSDAKQNIIDSSRTTQGEEGKKSPGESKNDS